MADLNNLIWFKLTDFEPKGNKLVALKQVINGKEFFHTIQSSNIKVIIPCLFDRYEHTDVMYEDTGVVMDVIDDYYFYPWAAQPISQPLDDFNINYYNTYWTYLPETPKELNEEIQGVASRLYEEYGTDEDVFATWADETLFRRYHIYD